MRKFLLIFILIFCSDFAWAGELEQSAEFEMYYGNGMFGYSTLKLEADKVVYTENYPSRPAKAETINISEGKWASFKKELDTLKIWDWKSDYPNASARDGTQWSIKISYPGKSLTSHGNNAYPLADATSNNSPEQSDAFKSLLTALKNLTGKELQ